MQLFFLKLDISNSSYGIEHLISGSSLQQVSYVLRDYHLNQVILLELVSGDAFEPLIV